MLTAYSERPHNHRSSSSSQIQTKTKRLHWIGDGEEDEDKRTFAAAGNPSLPRGCPCGQMRRRGAPAAAAGEERRSAGRGGRRGAPAATAGEERWQERSAGCGRGGRRGAHAGGEERQPRPRGWQRRGVPAAGCRRPRTSTGTQRILGVGLELYLILGPYFLQAACK